MLCLSPVRFATCGSFHTSSSDLEQEQSGSEVFCERPGEGVIRHPKEKTVKLEMQFRHGICQFGTQVKFRWSRDHNNRTTDNAFSGPWYHSEMEFEPVAG